MTSRSDWLLSTKYITTMIIWSGFGILVPLIAVLGVIAGTIVGSMFGISEMGFGLGLGLAAVGNWFLWKSINAKQGKVLVDPQTGQNVLVKPKHSLFFIPAGFWSLPMAVFAVFMLFIGSGAKESRARNEATPGFKEFEAANNLIDSSSKGLIHGNTEGAKAAAKEFSTMLKTMTSMAFTGGSKKNLMTGGEFLTYCQDGGDTIVVLCHVPSLRSYKDKEAKTALAELAWAAGTAAAEQIDPENKKTLVVGLRGIANFGSIQKGATTEGAKPKGLNTSDDSVFFAAFAPVVASAPESQAHP